MFKRFSTIVLMCVILMLFTSCDKKYTLQDLPKYPSNAFEISALSGPKELSEESLKQYKDAGLNVLAFSNHDGKVSSDSLYYLGSNRTIKALELCKKIGLDTYVAYGNTWNSRDVEGEDYFGDKPFSTHNYYSQYMDIIKGIRIADEPTKEKMAELAGDTFINDYKSIYPDKKYMINLIPVTAVASRNFTNYDEMLEIYGETIMSKFDKPYISVDVYPFSTSKNPESMIIYNYNLIAKCAKQYGAETTFILQSSTGKEFLDTLSEADMRLQAYLAIAFGADNLQYYSYSVPEEIQYNFCMLERDNKTPSEIYYYVKEVNSEVQKFASAVLAYNWNQSIGTSGTEETTYRVSSIELDEDFQRITEFDSSEKYVSTKATKDVVISQFTSEEYGEAYMFVNFDRDNGKTNVVDVTLKECYSVAIYGGEDYSGEAQIVELDENGKFTMELNYGEGAFVVPLGR